MSWLPTTKWSNTPWDEIHNSPWDTLVHVFAHQPFLKNLIYLFYLLLFYCFFPGAALMWFAVLSSSLSSSATSLWVPWVSLTHCFWLHHTTFHDDTQTCTCTKVVICCGLVGVWKCEFLTYLVLPGCTKQNLQLVEWMERWKASDCESLSDDNLTKWTSPQDALTVKEKTSWGFFDLFCLTYS